MSNQAVAATAGVSTGLGGFFQAFGATKSGLAKEASDKYQAQVATLRSQIDLQNASYALQEGELQAQRYGLQAGQRMGEIIATQASHGVDVTSGSAKQVQQSQQTVANIDLDTIRSNAAKTAYNYDVQSVFDQAQAGLMGMAAQGEAAAIPLDIASSVLGTAGSVASKWLQGGQYGIFNSGGTPAPTYATASNTGLGGSSSDSGGIGHM
jgi:hypothetical protein